MKDLKDTGICWTPEIRRSGFIIYWLVIVLVLTGMLSLFLIRVDVSVRATGVVRPVNERSDIRSPNGALMAECYVPSKDIGLLKNGQAARFLIDAYNYNYFGAATGFIFSIDNDFILLDKIPVYKVKCRLNESRLKLSNGFSGDIKKGMSFRVRFITCRRTIWQLLYDNLNDWMDPSQRPV
jgi:membrane fusion protein, peptide pheromone/bacteriocin exporter